MHEPLTIYFQKPNSLFGKLVSWVTGSPVSHVFISVGDKLFIEARLNGVKMFDTVEFNKRKVYATAKYKKFVRNVESRLVLIETSLSLINKHYDYLRSFAYMLKKPLNKTEQYNCVEVIKFVLDSFGIWHCVTGKEAPCDLIELECFLTNDWEVKLWHD